MSPGPSQWLSTWQTAFLVPFSHRTTAGQTESWCSIAWQLLHVCPEGMWSCLLQNMDWLFNQTTCCPRALLTPAASSAGSPDQDCWHPHTGGALTSRSEAPSLIFQTPRVNGGTGRASRTLWCHSLATQRSICQSWHFGCPDSTAGK